MIRQVSIPCISASGAPFMQIAGGAFPEMVGAHRHRQGLDGTSLLGLYFWENVPLGAPNQEQTNTLDLAGWGDCSDITDCNK